MMSEKREQFPDILRIIACVMVVGIHIAMEGWYDTSPRTYTWTVLNFYDTVFRPAVPLFIMLSGSLFLRKDHLDLRKLWTGSILRIFLIYVFWVVFYAVTNNGIHKVLGNPALIRDGILGPNPQYHLWYLRMILNIYAIAPILWILVSNLDQKLFGYYFCLFVLFGSVCNTILDLPFTPQWLHDQLNLFVDMDLVRYSGYFILGYWLSVKDPFALFPRKRILIIYLITVIAAAGLNQWIAAADDWPTQALYGNFSLPVLIESVCIFLLVRSRFSGSSLQDHKAAWLRRVSESTLFVYLIHPFVIQRIHMYLHFYTIDHNVLFSVPVMIILVFCLSSLIGSLLKKIPIINRFV